MAVKFFATIVLSVASFSASSARADGRAALVADDTATASASTPLFYQFPFVTADIALVTVNASGGHSQYTWTVETTGIGTDQAKLIVLNDTSIVATTYTLNLINGAILRESPGSNTAGPARSLEYLAPKAGEPRGAYLSALAGMTTSLQFIIQGGGGNSPLTPHPEMKIVLDYLNAIVDAVATLP